MFQPGCVNLSKISQASLLRVPKVNEMDQEWVSTGDPAPVPLLVFAELNAIVLVCFNFSNIRLAAAVFL